jgi:hypothetical protein
MSPVVGGAFGSRLPKPMACAVSCRSFEMKKRLINCAKKIG